MEDADRSAPRQAIVVRDDLRMRWGEKIAGGCFRQHDLMTLRIREPVDTFTEAERHWLDGAFTNICVLVDSGQELLAIVEQAREPVTFLVMPPRPW
jgi:peptidyl-tRNA hydrolase